MKKYQDPWVEKRLGEVFDTSSGGTPSRSSPEFYSGEIPWFTTGELKDCELNDSQEHITEQALSQSSAKIFPKDTLLVAMYGATIGKLGLLNSPAATNQACCALLPNSNCLTRFVYYWFQFNRPSIIELGCGAGQPNISQKIIRDLSLLLPSLPEQRAIARVLSDMDGLIGATERLISKKRAIKQALMHDLLSGKRRLQPFPQKNVPWSEKRLGEVCEMNAGGTPSRKNRAYFGGDIPWVSIGDMSKTEKYLNTVDEFLTEAGLQNSAAKIFPKNTLLFAMYASIGECCISIDEVCSSQAILGLYNLKSVDLEFLYYLLSNKKQEFIEHGQTGTQSNLSKRIMSNVVLLLPSFPEQRAIARVLSDADGEISALERKVEKLRVLKSGMMERLLTGAVRLPMGDGE